MTDLARTLVNGCGPQARGLQNRGRSSAEVRSSSHLSADVRRVGRWQPSRTPSTQRRRNLVVHLL